MGRGSDGGASFGLPRRRRENKQVLKPFVVVAQLRRPFVQTSSQRDHDEPDERQGEAAQLAHAQEPAPARRQGRVDRRAVPARGRLHELERRQRGRPMGQPAWPLARGRPTEPRLRQIKSTVEGPMFLFQRCDPPALRARSWTSAQLTRHSVASCRSQAPFYGFMILSTKGLEFVHELLTPAFDAVSEAGMIMFRASVDEGELCGWRPRVVSHAADWCVTATDRATGIWVQDDSDRKWMFKRMEECVAAPSSAAESCIDRVDSGFDCRTRKLHRRRPRSRPRSRSTSRSRSISCSPRRRRARTRSVPQPRRRARHPHCSRADSSCSTQSSRARSHPRSRLPHLSLAARPPHRWTHARSSP